MFANFDFDVIIRSLPYLFYDGMTFTLMLTALATAGGIFFGTLLAMMRLSGFAPISLLAGGYVNLIKNTSVALTIGLIELTAAARAMQEFTFQVFEAFTAATVIYIVINIAVTFGMRWIERRAAVPGFIGAAPAAAATH